MTVTSTQDHAADIFADARFMPAQAIEQLQQGDIRLHRRRREPVSNLI